MSEKRFVVESVKIIGDCNEVTSRISKVITDKDELYSYNDLYEISDLLNEQQATITALNEKIEQRNALLDKIEKALGEPIEEWLLGVKYK